MSHSEMDADPCIQPLVAVLQELSTVIERLSDAQYVQSPVGVVASSIGGHVRHCLDHVRAVLGGAASGELNYDHRERGTPVESSRQVALDEINGLSRGLRQLQAAQLQQNIQLLVLMTRDGQPVSVRTTLARELAYVLAHSIHHNALMSAMVKTLGAWHPDTFGYAPATLQHTGQAACVRSA